MAGNKFHSSDILLGRFSLTFSSGGLSRIEASCEALQRLVINEVEHVEQHQDSDYRPV
jgi:hypothetical protein